MESAFSFNPWWEEPAGQLHPAFCLRALPRQPRQLTRPEPFCRTTRRSQLSATLLFSFRRRDPQTFNLRDCCRAAVFTSRRSRRQIVLILPSLPQSFFHCQQLPSSSSISPSSQDTWVLCYSIVVGHIRTVCGFYAGKYSLQLPPQAQVWLSPEVGLRFGTLADRNMILPTAPGWYFHIKTTLF